MAICAAHYKIQNIAYMTWIVDPHDLHNNDGLYICPKDQPCRLTDAEKRFNPQFPLTSRLTTGKTKEALRRELSSSSAGERHSTAHTTTRPNDQQPRKKSTNSGPIGAPTQTHKAIIGARSNPRGIGSSSNISRAVLTPNSSSAQRRVQDSQHLAKPKTPVGQYVNAARKTSPTATSTKTDADPRSRAKRVTREQTNPPMHKRPRTSSSHKATIRPMHPRPQLPTLPKLQLLEFHSIAQRQKFSSTDTTHSRPRLANLASLKHMMWHSLHLISNLRNLPNHQQRSSASSQPALERQAPNRPPTRPCTPPRRPSTSSQLALRLARRKIA